MSASAAREPAVQEPGAPSVPMTQSLADRVLVQLEERADGSTGLIRSWHRLIPEGVWHHQKYGVLDFREKFFGELKQNFDGRARGIDVPIDLHHDETSDAGGWVLQTEYRPGDGFWGEVEWTDLGEEKVRKKRLRYFSAEFGPHRDEKTKKVTYPVLVAVTLTNRPFLKYQDPVDIPTRLSEGESDGEIIELSELVSLTDDEVARLADEPSGAQQTQARTAKKKSGSKPGARAEGESDEDEEEEEPQGPRTEPAPPASQQSRAVSNGKKATKKPAGNQGAPQPGQMRGPKPHITRGRRPDPSNEANHMSEQSAETTVESVSLAEFNEQKALIERLSARLNEKDAEAKTLAEQVTAMRLAEVKRDVADEARRLSEDRTVTLGDETKDAKYGIPAVVANAYTEMALSEAGFTREGVYAMLAALKAVGMVALVESGTGHAGVENDPEARLAEGDLDDNKIYALAQRKAQADGKTLATLSAADVERYMLLAEREVRG